MNRLKSSLKILRYLTEIQKIKQKVNKKRDKAQSQNQSQKTKRLTQVKNPIEQ